MSRLCPNCARLAQIGFKPSDCRGHDCTHCPWPGCVCTHTAGCVHGWLEGGADPDGYDTVVRCPTCALAAKDAALLISAGR